MEERAAKEETLFVHSTKEKEEETLNDMKHFLATHRPSCLPFNAIIPLLGH